MCVLAAIHAVEMAALLHRRFHVRDPIRELDSDGLGTAANLGMCLLVALAPIAAFLVGKPPDQIGHFITELAADVVDGDFGVLYGIMQPGGGEFDFIRFAEFLERRHDAAEVFLMKAAPCIFLTGMSLPRKSARSFY